MKILVTGPIAETHFLSNLLLEDPTVEIVYHCGANHSLLKTDRYIPVHLVDGEQYKILDLIKTVKFDLVVPIGINYLFWKDFETTCDDRGIPILMPRNNLGWLEWQKSKTKELLATLGIPSPKYKVYSKDMLVNDFFHIKRPFVVKLNADSLSGFQTVVITDDNFEEEYKRFVERPFVRHHDLFDKTSPLYYTVEEFIPGSGKELSYHALCNNINWQYLGSVRDYKKRYEGDIGGNTVSTGCYSPVNNVDPIIHEYADRIINYLKSVGRPYVGFLYLGIIISPDGVPMILEINTRPGTPEMIPLLLGIKNNIAELLYAAATNSTIPTIEFNDKQTVSVRLINKNYTLENVLNPPIDIKFPTLPINNELYINLAPSTQTMYSGSVTAIAPTINEASDKIYRYLQDLDLCDFTYRKDIGYLP
jgi:phosphoribosylamine--glycine ligase